MTLFEDCVMSEDFATLRTKLHKARKTKGMTLVQLSKKTGIATSTVSLILAGGVYKDISVFKLKRICEALEAD